MGVGCFACTYSPHGDLRSIAALYSLQAGRFTVLYGLQQPVFLFRDICRLTTYLPTYLPLIYRPKTYLFQCLASKANIQFARRQLSRAFLKRISPIPFNSEKSLAEFYLADFAQRLRITFRDSDVFELSLLAQLFQSPITLLQRTGYVLVLLGEDCRPTSLTL